MRHLFCYYFINFVNIIRLNICFKQCNSRSIMRTGKVEISHAEYVSHNRVNLHRISLKTKRFQVF
ncbi:unnamed protein product, partial [Schistosoma haematobium]